MVVTAIGKDRSFLKGYLQLITMGIEGTKRLRIDAVFIFYVADQLYFPVLSTVNTRPRLGCIRTFL